LVQYDDKPGLEYGIVANEDLRLNIRHMIQDKFIIGKLYLHLITGYEGWRLRLKWCIRNL